jgi:enamine deaminase RidA (YjgF/YER057c/UK114 family)
MSVEERLAEAGYPLPQPAPPGGAYVPAVQTGNLVYTSGQIPTVQGTLPDRFKGKVGGAVELETAREAAATCAVNALAAVKGLIGDLERVERVVKVVGFVASDPGFTSQPEVMNAASELLQTAFGENGRHARSAIGMAVLPRDTCVEVEIIVQVR